MPHRVRRAPGRPPGGVRVADREALLDAAERVVSREGNGASLDAIAREAGVTKPIVYARIGSRADLSNALAERLSARLMEASTTALAGHVRPGHTTLAVMFRTILDTIGAHRELFLFVTRGTGDDAPTRTLYLAGQSALPLAEMLTAWSGRSGADVEAAVPRAYGIIGMLNLVALWWMEQPALPAAVVADQLADLVWSGLRPGARQLPG